MTTFIEYMQTVTPQGHNCAKCPYQDYHDLHGYVCGWAGFYKGEPNCTKGVYLEED